MKRWEMDDKAAAWRATRHGTGTSGKEGGEGDRKRDGLRFHYIPLIQPSSQHITDKAHTDSSPQCVCARLCILTELICGSDLRVLETHNSNKVCYVSTNVFMYMRQHSTSHRVTLHETCLVVSSCVYKLYKHKSQSPLQMYTPGVSLS